MRTFALTLAYSGCRISEALELTLEHVDLSAKSLRLRTLKQRNQTTYRSVPLPDHHLDALELVHRIRKQQKTKNGGKAKLWSWGRIQATKHIWAVMQAAGIEGDRASPKGLRHGFGVGLAQKARDRAWCKSYWVTRA